MTKSAQVPKPENEESRLQAVRSYHILDTPPAPEFDVATRLASYMFSVPIALVALMDEDRLWFKSKHGLGVLELEREIAFCAHAIMRPSELMVIEDLRADPRFDQNPLVAGPPNLRFYAGVPLLDPKGYALGTMAIVDYRERRLDAGQLAALSDLSLVVCNALEGHKRAVDLSRMATTDFLTGVSNRAHFEAAMSIEFRQAQRTGDSVSLLCLDLDAFKQVNDTFGHSAGDEVLREVARRLGALIRAGDTLARLGGDEFAIVFRAGADPTAAHALAERIVESLAAPIAISDDEDVSIGVSIGIANWLADSVSTETLYQRADKALYRAKKQRSRRWAVA